MSYPTSVILIFYLLLVVKGDYITPDSSQDARPMKSVAVPKVVTSRNQLLETALWVDEQVQIVRPVGKADPSRVDLVMAKVIAYRPPNRDFTLAIVRDQSAGYDYVVRGQQSFYIPDGEHLLACMVGSGTLQLRRSIFRTQASTTGVDAAILEFVAAVDDAQLFRADGPASGREVDLKPNTPPQFWTAGSSLSSQIGRLEIMSAAVSEQVLTLRLRSDGGKYEGTFWVDLARSSLMRSVISQR